MLYKRWVFFFFFLNVNEKLWGFTRIEYTILFIKAQASRGSYFPSLDTNHDCRDILFIFFSFQFYLLFNK